MKVLKSKLDRYGYPAIGLITKNGKKFYKTIHRLVGEVWISNPMGLPQINHIDGIKTNNKVNNLEWISAKNNVIHSLENSLSRNSNHCVLLDTVTGKEQKFISVKSIAKHLDINLNVLVPLIKYSSINPVNQRYVIKLKDEISLETVPNTMNFGREVWVYDLVNIKLVSYKSVNLTAYHTGVRSLGSLNKKAFIIKAGYVISFCRDTVLNNLPEIKGEYWNEERVRYLLEPYSKRAECYYIYNYYTGEEIKFKDLNNLVLFVNKNSSSKKIYTTSQASVKISDAADKEKTGLINGFGIKSSSHNFDWYPYTEEVILSSKYGYSAPIRIYRLCIDDNIQLVFGLSELIKKTGYELRNKSLSNITHFDILKSVNIPNLSIDRLNKPLKLS